MLPRKNNPGHVFFLKQDESIETLPARINGIHLLATFLLARFVKSHGFETTREGKFDFIQWLLTDDINNRLSPEEFVNALAAAVFSVFDVRKNSKDSTLNSRDSKHVEYNIKKELESVWLLFNTDC